MVFEEGGAHRPRPCEDAKAGLAAAARTMSASERKASRHEMWRARFMASLTKAGLHVEEVRGK